MLFHQMFRSNPFPPNLIPHIGHSHHLNLLLPSQKPYSLTQSGQKFLHFLFGGEPANPDSQ